MHKFLALIATGVVTFAATNIDDILLLMLFFSQVSRSLRRWHIVTGQYLGFTALVLISLLGFVGGLLVPRAWIGLLGIFPIVLGVRQWLNRAGEEERESPDEAQAGKASKAGSLAAITSVASVTFANGGDNLGIYTPLFATVTLPGLIIILSVFYALVAVWCYAGYVVTRHPLIARTLTHYGHLFVPFVLVALGVYIILESGTLTLLGL